MEIIRDIIVQDKKIPRIKPGDIVRVYLKSKDKEGKASIFEGMIIAIDGGQQPEATFTVRRVTFGIGVERIFPLYSPLIQKIEVKKSTKVKQAKLYYLRKKFGKKFKLKEKDIDKDVLELMISTEESAKMVKSENKQQLSEKEKENQNAKVKSQNKLKVQKEEKEKTGEKTQDKQKTENPKTK